MKKFFALASVTALAGVVFSVSAAGCSSSTNSSSSSSGGTEAGTDAGKDVTAPKDSGPEDSGPSECPAAFPGDPPWKTPAAADTTKCDQSDIDFIKGEADKSGMTFQQLETSLKARKAACATCVFTKEGDAAWGPIVYVGTSGGAFFNYGSCFARAPGGSEACGQAIEQFELCAESVCDDTACGSDNATKACIQKVIADKTSCGKFNFQTACPNIQQLDAVCKTGLDAIAIMCGPGPQDGGGGG